MCSPQQKQHLSAASYDAGSLSHILYPNRSES
jgi:hypothetical protein